MTIKEVEQYLEVPRATVRFYEKEGLMNPVRSDNGYREYSEKDIDRLKQIIIFRKLGMNISDIEDILDGVKPLSEAISDNILNLEKQIDELNGALLICHRLQEEQEEMSTFEADRYWKVIAEEEKKGNHFVNIAKDMVRFEKTIILEYFGIADRDGNLSVSIPNAFTAVLSCTVLFIVISCFMEGAWTLQNILKGLRNLLWLILLEVFVGLPIFLIGRKHPNVLKKRKKIMFFVLLGLFVTCVLLLVFL